MAGEAPAGAAISLRQTLGNSKWLGQTCPKCGNTLAEGEQVVLCPKCYTPQHAQCWQDNGSKCAVDETPARIIVRAGQSIQPAAAGGAAPTSAAPAQQTPSRDTDPAAQGRAGTSAAPERAGAVRPEAAPAGAPPPPRAVPGAGAARGRPAAGAATREAVGLRPMATVREALEKALGDMSPEFGTAVDEVSVTVPAERIQEAARRAKEHEDLRFDYLRCLSGVDYQAEGIEVVYHLFSSRLLQKCALKARVSGEGQGLPTVTPVWAGADWHEREAAEMFNIRFEGHPYPEPILLQRDERGEVVPGPILLKRFPLRPKEPPGIYGFPEEE
ncbi:MAG TPA: NADH-quinone oxidoreductase subunit C [Chloroflexota bacterium]|nr:NADH-quinone oxidoreductase subunit C [Chloroflexota bacterium]